MSISELQWMVLEKQLKELQEKQEYQKQKQKDCEAMMKSFNKCFTWIEVMCNTVSDYCHMQMPELG